MTTDYMKDDLAEAFRPLDRLAGTSAPEFMFMGRKLEAGPHGQDIYSYKHIETRSYVHIDAGGNGFRWVGQLFPGDVDVWVPVDAAEALAEALR